MIFASKRYSLKHTCIITKHFIVDLIGNKISASRRISPFFYGNNVYKSLFWCWRMQELGICYKTGLIIIYQCIQTIPCLFYCTKRFCLILFCLESCLLLLNSKKNLPVYRVNRIIYLYFFFSVRRAFINNIHFQWQA